MAFGGAVVAFEGVGVAEDVAANALFTDVVGDGGGAGGDELVDEVSVDLLQAWPHGRLVAWEEVEGFELTVDAAGIGLTAFFMADST